MQGEREIGRKAEGEGREGGGGQEAEAERKKAAFRFRERKDLKPPGFTRGGIVSSHLSLNIWLLSASHCAPIHL